MLALDTPRAACADHLDLVDATFIKHRGNGSQGKQLLALATLRHECCMHCPIRKACHIEGQDQKHGAWG
jgi:hypothetical protein